MSLFRSSESRHRVAVAAAAVALLGAAATSQGSIVIDTFDVTEQLIVGNATDNGAFNSADTVEGEAIGNNRDIQVWRDSESGHVLVDTFIQQGKLSYNSTSGAEGRALISWDGANKQRMIDLDGLDQQPGSGFVGVDLTQGGANTALEIVVASEFTTTLTLWVYSDGTGYSANLTVPGGEPSTAYYVPFADFSAPMIMLARASVAGPSPFSSVGALALDIDGTGGAAGLSLSVDSITAVPEPGTWAAGVGALGALGLALAVRRRRQAID